MMKARLHKHAPEYVHICAVSRSCIRILLGFCQACFQAHDCHFVSLTPCVANAYKMPTCEFFETSHFRREACFLGNHFPPFVLMCLAVHNASHAPAWRDHYPYFWRARSRLSFRSHLDWSRDVHAKTCISENRAKWKVRVDAQSGWRFTLGMFEEAVLWFSPATLCNYLKV